MAVDVRITTAALFIFAVNIAFAEDRCRYMTEIPRPETPNLPVRNFDGLTWSERPLLPVDEREDLCMENDFIVSSATNGAQLIYMEEEIEGHVAIARLNYKGSATPTIVSPFTSGSFISLAPVIRRIPEDGGDWHLVITQRQDFEAPGMQLYLFELRIQGEAMVPMVILQIVNIDDNFPIIHMVEPCQLTELGETGITHCKYNVSDADGEISTRFMRFTIESDRDDEEYFKIIRENEPGEWMWTHMVLNLLKPLDFEINPLHIFRVTAWDSKPNTHTATMMVQVENVDRRPPRWMEIFAVQQFNEKTNQTFTVRAIDGDTGINKPIFYRLETDPEDTFFSIETIEGGRDGAIFSVSEIDRDTLEREVFQLTIIAYKYGDDDEEGSPSFETRANVVIIVIDVNDQTPTPFEPEYNIDILEETAMTLNLENFGFHDRDLGENAQYEVRLESVFPPGAEDGFHISPEVGYQRQSFIVGTRNHSLLDYEVEDFQHIQLKVIATDMNNTSLVGVAILNVNLINWNDEIPIFEHSIQTVTFDETEGAGFEVGTVRAHDRDFYDRVEHSLLGNAGEFLTIDQGTGVIHVAANDSFDFHRQSELFVQIRAVDTLGEPYNTATSQLVIQLRDINNTPPTLRLPRGSPRVEENVPAGFVISSEISASDPDSTAELRFEIHWDSSYATKQGRVTPENEFHHCVEIDTIYPSINSRGTAIGRLVAREIRDNVTIDYEEFEVLYLTIRVRDINTVYGDDYDESTLAVTIIDMNDNAPQWAAGSLQQPLRVREVSASGVVIGSVLATDIDGPLYNQVRYTIFNKEDTPPELVAIDFYTGQITVKQNQAIDADEPPRHFLHYTVIASDKCYEENIEDCPPDPTYWDTPGDLTIQIIDTNNKEPEPDYTRFETTVYVWENATTGDEVVQLYATDIDRDEIYHRLSYQIQYAVNPRLRDFFAVDLDTGLVYVDYTTDEVLDRDGDEPQHRIFINIIDNFLGDGDGNRNQANTEILVVLLDVNDNAPELPLPSELSWEVSENLKEGVRLEPDIYAPDRDEPDTDNSRVGYAILDLTVKNRDIEVPELFNMIQIQNVTGELETAMDLRGYWGTYDIHIQAYDHGIPQQISDEVYELIIRPYNYHSPKFVFPEYGHTIRLARERAVVNGVLVTAAGELLERISATDEDGLHAGSVTFSVIGDANSQLYFDVSNDGENSGALVLSQLLPQDPINVFQLTLRATDGGTEPGPLHADCALTVVFVPTQGEPVFTPNTATVAFIEKEAGLLESHQLPLAEDLKNYMCYEVCHEIYYSIIDGNADGLFVLDLAKNIVSLSGELDRAVSASHTLVVAASNSPGAASALPASTLTVTVNVREADPRPVFTRRIYTAGISTIDTINRELLTVQATHTEGLPVTYSLDQSTMVVDASLEAVRDSAFNLHRDTGLLTLNIQPSASMHGMFEFDVVATDSTGATDRAEVKIYLISSMNRVFFVFVNTLEQVEENRLFIAQTLSTGFQMTCNIDQVVPASNSNGVALDDMTEVRGHFIRDNVPVPAIEIEELRSDRLLLRSIQQALLVQLLVLQDFVTGSSPEVGADGSLVTIYVLVALTVLLAFMCLVLLVTFIVRTRALNRRLEALSMTKYGSVDSGLNRAGLAAPGTNKHAIEGSNPIWNETIKAPDFDTISDASNDSDLIGIEDLPQFRSDYFPPPDDSSLQAILPDDQSDDTVANHSNNFKFNTSPFSPEFANTQLRR